MELHLKIIGIIKVFLALMSGFFPKRFDWKKEFGAVSLLNRQMMYIHTLFIGVVIFLMGVLCLIATEDLVYTRLGKMICCGFGLFWALRLYIQFFGYKSELWRGKRFETIVHIIFSLLWAYFTFVFFKIIL